MQETCQPAPEAALHHSLCSTLHPVQRWPVSVLAVISRYVLAPQHKQNKLGVGTGITGLPVKRVFRYWDKMLGHSNERQPL